MDNTTINNNSAVYYQHDYWNDYTLVREHINERVSGDKNKNWMDRLKDVCKNRKFKRALILNCGNGWVEREMYSKGLFEEAIGVDCSVDLINEARDKKSNMPLEYVVMDTNTAEFPVGNFDLVINHAAAHHVAYLDKVLLGLNKVMTKDSYFVSFDYVGPHRNQYPLKQWLNMISLNNQLPVEIRQDLKYPHLPTMLYNDPTEAIHSELFLNTLKRYFKIEEQKKIGGALAYSIMTFNKNMRGVKKEILDKWIPFILKGDQKYLDHNPNSSMFDFIVASPIADINTNKILPFLRREEKREKKAKGRGGLYYWKTIPQKFYYTVLEYFNIKNN
jgi:SAM-dependent methyltransferase